MKCFCFFKMNWTHHYITSASKVQTSNSIAVQDSDPFCYVLRYISPGLLVGGQMCGVRGPKPHFAESYNLSKQEKLCLADFNQILALSQEPDDLW